MSGWLQVARSFIVHKYLHPRTRRAEKHNKCSKWWRWVKLKKTGLSSRGYEGSKKFSKLRTNHCQKCILLYSFWAFRFTPFWAFCFHNHKLTCHPDLPRWGRDLISIQTKKSATIRPIRVIRVQNSILRTLNSILLPPLDSSLSFYGYRQKPVRNNNALLCLSRRTTAFTPDHHFLTDGSKTTRHPSCKITDCYHKTYRRIIW